MPVHQDQFVRRLFRVLYLCHAQSLCSAEAGVSLNADFVQPSSHMLGSNAVLSSTTRSTYRPAPQFCEEGRSIGYMILKCSEFL